VLTGAGVSAESGIATFRDRLTGLWERFRAEDLATPEAFARDPALVWGWYEWRRAAVLRAQPNPAHFAIARMAERVSQLTLVTQNVDDLHERAGSRDVLHLHGEIARPYCEKCRKVHTAMDSMPDTPDGGQRLEPPMCPLCGGRVRPGVVWFGESLPDGPWRAAVRAVNQCDVFLCVGTSAVVQPAASLIDLAKATGAVTVQVNPNPTEADSLVDHSLRGKAGEVLPGLVEAAWPAGGS
jgi:NAD-dependent deacetylase